MPTFKVSTGLRNYLLSRGSLKKAFENCLIKVFSGSAPPTADAAQTGTLLCVFTKNSGSVASGDRAKPQIVKVTVTSADQLTTVSLGGADYTYNPGGTMPVHEIALNLSQVINDSCPVCVAVPSGNDGVINVMSRTAGDAFSYSGKTNCTAEKIVDAIDNNCLNFAEDAVSGELRKGSEVWSGVNLANGVAGYFRIVTTSDDGLESTTQLRLQGNCAISGECMTLSNLTFTAGATTTIDAASISLPAF